MPPLRLHALQLLVKQHAVAQPQAHRLKKRIRRRNIVRGAHRRIGLQMRAQKIGLKIVFAVKHQQRRAPQGGRAEAV